MIRELFGMANKEDVRIRNQMGMGFSDDRATQIGQVLGQIGADITQDRSRELWWLINAPQAAANIAQEVALKYRAPDLFKAGNLTLRAITLQCVSILDRDKEPRKG